MGRKLALIIGNSRYDDPGLARLTTADVDVRELAGVLRTPDIGQFDEVVELPNEGLAVVRRSIAQFFSQAKKDDLLLFYFSGHGVKDENGQLYLAVRDTEPRLLAGTGIEAAFITAQMDRSYSKRQVLIFDCCHSGAFAYGSKTGGAQVVGTGPVFEGTGYGHVVLTATDSTQYAWEGDQFIGESDKSVFTHHLLQGLRTGEADRDGDGLVTVDELYEYVHKHVVSETPKQTPKKWSYKQEGDIVIARNPHPLARAAELPLEIRALIDSPLSRLRAEAVPELARLLHGRHHGLALAARRALEDLRADDSRRVSAAAEEVLSTLSREAEAAAAAAHEAERLRLELEQLVAEASERLTRQDLSGALAQVDVALKLDPSSSVAVALRDRIRLAVEEAREREELERQAHERRQKVAALIGRANRAASPQAALDALGEALELDPGHEPARQLLAKHTTTLERMAAQRARQQEIAAARLRIEDLLQKDELSRAEEMLAQAEKGSGDLTAFAELRQALRQKQHDRLAAEVVEQARREFAAGRHESAVAALEQFNPPHPLVSRSRSVLASDLERLRRQEEERKRTETERRAREQEVVSLRDAACLHLERQRFVEALDALHRAQQRDPEARGLIDLIEAAETGKIAAEEARRRRDASEGKRSVALKRFRGRDFARALAAAEEASRLDPENVAASGLRDEIQKALNEYPASADAAPPQWRLSLQSMISLVRVSRPLQMGLVAMLLATGLVLFRFPARDVAPPENAKPPAPTAPAGETPQEPVPAGPSLPPETTPPVLAPAAPAPAKPDPGRGGTGRSLPPAADPTRTSRGFTPAPTSAAPVPSDVERRIASLLADGDRLMQARDYIGALSAYEEAGRLGSATGRERAEKAGQERGAQEKAAQEKSAQERATQVRSRLNRAEQLQDTGSYEEALRAIDEALALDPKSVEGRRLRQRVLDAQSFERALRPGFE